MTEGPSSISHLRALPPVGDVSEAVEERVEHVFSHVLSTRCRTEVTVVQGPTPQRLAPYALTMLASVPDPHDPEEDIANGRFVLLHDPAGPPSWNGTWRIVTFLSASMDSATAHDPLLPEVAQTWLHEGAAVAGVDISELSGTVTVNQSYPFGALAGRAANAEVEIRCSWTPQLGDDEAPDARAHLRAWLHVMATASGLAPEIDGVPRLPHRN